MYIFPSLHCVCSIICLSKRNGRWTLRMPKIWSTMRTSELKASSFFSSFPVPTSSFSVKKKGSWLYNMIDIDKNFNKWKKFKQYTARNSKKGYPRKVRSFTMKPNLTSNHRHIWLHNILHRFNEKVSSRAYEKRSEAQNIYDTENSIYKPTYTNDWYHQSKNTTGK